jgi:phospholipid/cholesterol/gamma-HCH transport system substrate-binding protein
MVEPGAELRSQESDNIADVVGAMRDALGSIRSLTDRIDARVAAVMTDDLARDLGRLARASAQVVEEVERGHGLIHEVIYDRRLAADAAHVGADTTRAISRVDRLLAQVEDGPSALHGLVYDRRGAEALASLEGAAQDLALVASEVRGGKGLLHDLVYEREYGEILTNLATVSQTLKRLGTDVSEGRGTIGALLRDPTVYEDLKLILGNVERNRLLKALLRYAIKRDGLRSDDSGDTTSTAHR